MRTALPALAAVLLLGCGDKAETGTSPDDTAQTAETGDTDETGEPLPDCPEVPAEACSDRPDCISADGRPTQTTEEGTCVEYSTEATAHGCLSKKGGCGDIPVLAAPEAGAECWWFPNTCIPQGWVKCGSYDKWEECPPE